MAERIGKYTINLQNNPKILSHAGIVGKKEGEGSLANFFDRSYQDTKLGADSFEEAESRFQKEAIDVAMSKISLKSADLDYVFAGDLLSQCIGSTFGLKDKGIPLIGMYGACSTMALSLANAALFIEGEFAKKVAAVTSSHYCSSERQFRFPLEYGGVRPPSAQWTVTGSGCLILGQSEKNLPYISKITFGKIYDAEITDQNNMGAAMAPAAADTIKNFFKDSGGVPGDYDMILTGDLGRVGSPLLHKLLNDEGIDIKAKHKDCGILIFDEEQSDVLAGGSGCGCSASVLSTYIMKLFERKEISKILFIATGALLSPTSVLQNKSIPSIAHLVEIRI